ncbi:MarR family winged helix-turn-helix transcriptional regulator [uncultured Bdellovibrio sp.]|uniref:MarR family winged helix-turn-helix transcriptional regulator n=1 Tax=Bdellovibrio sp. HCB-162 TaxID=3394234 RepID=UPI0025D3A3A7|nr:MarR family transcriptional regulator [uncultured Bdellovibrio sp.]
MAKLFIQNLPSKEEFKAAATRLHEEVDSSALYTNLLFMKVATELENYLDGLLAPYNLSSGRFTLLYLLSDAPEGLMPSELSQRVGVTQATISGLINSLEKAELIKRELHQKDGRSFVIKLADKGEALIKEIFPQWAPKVAAFWNQVSLEERSDLNGILDRMVKNTSMLS